MCRQHRRYRCTYMRSRFTNNASGVDVAQRVFQADPSAKAFMCSGKAVCCFYNDFVFPLSSEIFLVSFLA